MAGFNVSFLNPKLRKATGSDVYSSVVNSLQIKEKLIAKDSYATPGEWNNLADEAQALKSSPGLSDKNRSDLDVYIARYSSNASSKALEEKNNLKTIERNYQDDLRDAVRNAGDSTAGFIQYKLLALQAKDREITTAIDQKLESGADATEYMLQHQSAQQDYADLTEALDVVLNYKEGETVSSRFTKYVKTNDQGEVIDVDVTTDFSKSGYVRTNAIDGGIAVAGNARKSNSGESYFIYAGERFSGADQYIPRGDGTFEQGILTDDTSKSGGSIKRTVGNSPYIVRPNLIKLRSAYRVGQVLDSDGRLYEVVGPGDYKKLPSVENLSEIGKSEIDRVPITDAEEKSVIPSTFSAVNSIQGFQLPQGASRAPVINEDQFGAPQQLGPVRQSAQDNTVGVGRSRTGGPISSSPATQSNIFQKTAAGAKGFIDAFRAS